MFIVDAILALIFVLTVIRCAALGITRGLAGILAWILATVAALYCCAPVSEFVYDNVMSERIEERLEESIESIDGAQEVTTTIEVAMQKMPDFLARVAESVGLDRETLVQKTQVVKAEKLAETLEREVFRPMVIAGFRVLFFLLLLFILTGILLFLLRPLSTVVKKIPGISTADKALGGVLGLLKGAVIVSVLAVLFRLVPTVVDNPDIAKMVEQSKIIAFVSDSPFLSGLFT